MVSTSNPSSSYQESIRRIHELQKKDPKDLNPTGHAIVMEHGRKVKKAIVFFHGFTSSPRQFERLGEEFFKLGYNVYIPRIPHHGKRQQMNAGLEQLTAEKLIWIGNEAADIIQGLGEEVIIVGLSMGGAITGWLAQYRSDIDQAILIAPTFGTARVPNFFLKSTINYFLICPNHFIWWDSKKKANLIRPPGTYQGFPSKAFGQVRRLGWNVQVLSKNKKPRAKSILMITNANDDAISKEGVDFVMNNWKRNGYAVKSFDFPENLNLGHDLIDPEQFNQNISVVYPKLIELINSKGVK